jgi:hypothetical protein
LVDYEIIAVYNIRIMKAVKLNLPAPTPRRHRALFDADLPFRGRRQQPKTLYQRWPKHARREQVPLVLE